MALSPGHYVHSSIVMDAAGFTYTGLNDTVCCVICKLTVSQWTHNMDPLTVHSERSPQCVFVRSIQILNRSKSSSHSRSLSMTDFQSQSASKRAKVEVASSWTENDGLKRARPRTFSHWTVPGSFCSRLMEAGFFGCNIEDRVICIYCDLICEKWNIELDDPCEVHEVRSPNCPFVKSMFNCTSVPHHMDYMNPERRLASFPTSSNHRSVLIEERVQAGFFFDGSNIKCFYCNGSFANSNLNNHPVAEHVQWNPYCKYARQLCGQELYRKIRRSINSLSSTVQSRRVNQFDKNTISKLVADRLDLPKSKNLIDGHQFERSVVKHCWEDQFRHHGDDFSEDVDQYIACLIRQKQKEVIEGTKNCVIPSLSTPQFGQQRRRSLDSNRLLVSYTDLLQSFGNDLQEHATSQQELGELFKEDKAISLKRERSLNQWPYDKPSRRDMIKGGWIVSKDDSTCPHCHVKYYHWKLNDNPWLIHKHLSPLCLFVLATNPLNFEPIPIKKLEEQCTDEEIGNAMLQPYDGLVQAKHESIFSVSERSNSFEQFPGGRSDYTDQLALSGLYYANRTRSIRCFYCKRGMSISTQNAIFPQWFERFHRWSRCHYIRQLNDNPSQLLAKQASGKCPCCMEDEQQLVALPCRHICLCQTCGQIKRLCPTCDREVAVYAIVYSS